MNDADTQREYERVAGEVASLDRRIANMTRWGAPKADSINAQILPSLIAKRERLLPLEADLKARAPAIRPLDFDVAAPIHFRKLEWVPAGTVAIHDIPPIPDCLRRQR